MRRYKDYLVDRERPQGAVQRRTDRPKTGYPHLTEEVSAELTKLDLDSGRLVYHSLERLAERLLEDGPTQEVDGDEQEERKELRGPANRHGKAR